MLAGDPSLTSFTTTEVVALVDRTSSIKDEASEALAAPRSGEEPSHLLLLENGAPASGAVSEKDPAGPGSNPRLGPASQGEVKLNLHTESAKQVCSCIWLVVLPIVTYHWPWCSLPQWL